MVKQLLRQHYHHPEKLMCSSTQKEFYEMLSHTLEKQGKTNMFEKLKNKERNYSLSKNFFYNTVGTVLLRSIGLITAPIISHILTTAEYGSISTYNLWFSFFGIFIGLQSASTLNNASIDYSEEEYKKYMSNALCIGLLSMLILLIPFLLFTTQMENLLKIEPGLGLLIIPQCFFNFCINFLSNHFIARKQSLRNLFLSFTVSIATSVASIFFLTTIMPSVQGYVLGNFLPTVLIGCVIFLMLLIRGKSFFNHSYWKYCLIISTPLIFHSLSGLILGQSNVFLLRYLKDESITGIYSFTFNITTVLTAIYSALNHSWVPFYFEFLSAGKEQLETMLQKVKNFDFTFLYLAIGFILVSPEVIQILSPETYWDGIKMIPFIVTGTYFIHLYGFSVNFEFFHKKTKWIATGTIITTVINVLFNLIVIPLFGYMGAAFSTMISYFMLFLFHNFIARKKIGNFPIPNQVFFKSILQLISIDIIFFIFYNLWIVRWILAMIVGILLLRRWIKQRSLI